MVNNSTNSTKRTTICGFHLNPLNTKKAMTYGIRNLDPGLGQTQKVAGLNL
jgi:hypothetical protein